MSKHKKIILFEIIFFVALLLADLLSKHLIMNFLNQKTVGYYIVIDKVLSFKHTLNYGASFGIFSGKTGFLIAFTAIALLLVVGLLVYFHYKHDILRRGGVLLSVSLTMVLAGGIGNLIDRIAFGYVRDFIEYKFVETLFNRTFAICNVADIELTLGVAILIVYVLFFYQDKKKPKAIAACSDNSAQDDTNIAKALKLYEDKQVTAASGQERSKVNERDGIDGQDNLDINDSITENILEDKEDNTTQNCLDKHNGANGNTFKHDSTDEERRNGE